MFPSRVPVSSVEQFLEMKSQRGVGRRLDAARLTTVFNLALVALLLAAVSPASLGAASFQEDANGFVFMNAENFDLNVTQNNGEWRFDNTPLAVDPFSGWGYMDAFSTGG